MEPDETDFVSIDDDSDIDFFSFTVTSESTLDALLIPAGSRYMEGPQNGNQTRLRTGRLSDLNLAIFDTDGVTQLGFANNGGLGEDESLDLVLPEAGTYFARIQGAQNNIQLYELNLTVSTIPEPSSWVCVGLGLCGLLPRRRR